MSGNIAIVYSTGTDAVAQAFGDAAAGLAAHVRVLWVPGDEEHERRGSHPIAAFDDVRWADGIAFGTPLGDGRPAGALTRFIEGMEPLWISGWLNDKVVTVFTDRPSRSRPTRSCIRSTTCSTDGEPSSSDRERSSSRSTRVRQVCSRAPLTAARCQAENGAVPRSEARQARGGAGRRAPPTRAVRAMRTA